MSNFNVPVWLLIVFFLTQKSRMFILEKVHICMYM